MLRMFQGTVKGLDGARVIVEVEDSYGRFEAQAYIVAAGGASKTKVWAPPAEGDRVLCVLDDEDSSNVFILGCIWTDDAVPAIVDEDGIYLEAEKMVTLGKSDGAKPIPRDDHLQSELDSIKSALGRLENGIKTHTHAVTGSATIPDGVVTATAGPAGSTAPHGYSVGDTACERVEGY